MLQHICLVLKKPACGMNLNTSVENVEQIESWKGYVGQTMSIEDKQTGAGHRIPFSSRPLLDARRIIARRLCSPMKSCTKIGPVHQTLALTACTHQDRQVSFGTFNLQTNKGTVSNKNASSCFSCVKSLASLPFLKANRWTDVGTH